MNTPRRFLSIVVLLLLAAAPLVANDEARFNPPLDGAYLGVQLRTVDGRLYLESVDELGAAGRAGLLAGDRLVRFAGHDELGRRGVDGIIEILATLSPRTVVEVIVERDGSLLRLDLTPDPRLVRDAVSLARHLQQHGLFKALDGDKRALLEQLEQELRNAVRESRFAQEAYEALNHVVGRFEVSHTALIPPWTYSAMVAPVKGDAGHYHLGLLVQKVRAADSERYFVQDLMLGGPAAKTGLRIGDEVVSVNDRAFATSPRRVLAGYEAPREIFTVQIDRDAS